MADPVELTVRVPAALWLTANGRDHWATKSRRTSHLRQLGFLAARNLPAVDRANVVAVIGYPTARRADPANAAPTVKALLDGAVDAGLLPDDDHKHIPRTSYERGPDSGERGVYLVTIRLEPLP